MNIPPNTFRMFSVWLPPGYAPPVFGPYGLPVYPMLFPQHAMDRALHSNRKSRIRRMPSVHVNRPSKQPSENGQNAIESTDDDHKIDDHQTFEQHIVNGDVEAAQRQLINFDTSGDIFRIYQDECKFIRLYDEITSILYENRNYRRVVEHVDEALKIAPNCSRFKLKKTECLVFLGDVDAVNKFVKQWIDSDSANADAVYSYGLCLYFQDNLKSGLEFFSKAIEIDPNHSLAKAMLSKATKQNDGNKLLQTFTGNKAFKQRKFQEAHALFSEALEIYSEFTAVNSKLFCRRACASSKLGNMQDAIDDCTKAMEANPLNYRPLLLRSQYYNNLKNYKECLNDYNVVSQMKGDCKLTENLLKNLRTNLIKDWMNNLKTLLTRGALDMAKICLANLKEIEVKESVIQMYEDQCNRLTLLEEELDECFGKNEYQQAVELTNEALGISKDCFKFKAMKAESLAFLGSIDEAITLAKECTKSRLPHTTGHYVLGLCSYLTNNLEDALVHLDRSLQFCPENRKAKAIQSKAIDLIDKKKIVDKMMKSGKFKDARRLYTQALKIDPLNKAVNSTLHMGRAHVNALLGNQVYAINDCTKVLEANPSNIEALLLRAKCHKNMENYTQSIWDYQSALNLDQSEETERALRSVESLAQLGSKLAEYYEKMDYHAVVDNIDEAMKITPTCSKYKLLRAECSAFLGRNDEAKEVAILCTMSNSNNADAFYVRGLYSCLNSNFEEGLMYFHKTIIMDPEHKKAKLMRTKAKIFKNANEMMQKGNLHDAQTLYTEALDAGPQKTVIDSILYSKRALVNSKLGKTFDAICDCTKALALNESNTEALVLRANCNKNLSKFEDCIADYETALKVKETKEIKAALNDAKAEFSIHQLEQQIFKCYEMKKYSTAVERIDDALKRLPAEDRSKTLKLNIMKAECLIFLGRIEEASGIAALFTAAHSLDADAFYVRGLCSYYKDRLHESQMHFYKALSLDPDHCKAKMVRLKVKKLKEKREHADELFKKGDVRKARELYTEALAIDPMNMVGNSILFCSRALCNMKSGCCGAAIADCESAMKANKQNVNALVARADCYYEMENFDRSVKDYEAALATLGDIAEIRRKLQNAKIRQEIMDSYEKRRYHMAVLRIDEVLKTDRDPSSKFKLLKAECLIFLGRIDEASGFLLPEIRLRFFPNVDACYVRGLYLYYQNRLEEGLTYFRRALILCPNHSKTKLMESKVKNFKEKCDKADEMYKTGEYGEAVKFYTDALEIDPSNTNTNSIVFASRAQAHSKLGNARDAVSDCSSALRTHPLNVKNLLLRAACHKEMTCYDESILDYEAALRISATVEVRTALNDCRALLKRATKKDYYAVLGLDKSAASSQTIKMVYRKLALWFHPDKHPTESKVKMEEKFKKIGEAYATLSHPGKKREFDLNYDHTQFE